MTLCIIYLSQIHDLIAIDMKYYVCDAECHLANSRTTVIYHYTLCSEKTATFVFLHKS